jgi:hypothetical protein
MVVAQHPPDAVSGRNRGDTMRYSKAYQPTQARDKHGNVLGTWDSPFLAKAREELEVNLGWSEGGWTFTPTTDPRGRD